DDVVLGAEEVAALDTRGDKEPKPGRGKVSRLFSRIAPAVLDVSVGESEKITVTPDHEFWVMGEGWKSARELWVGAKLLTKSGKIVTVENIRRREGTFQVYNFEVSEAHTYFVGKLALLVHNQCPDFIVGPNGTVYPVPEGATGPTPVINPAGRQTGVAFTG